LELSRIVDLLNFDWKKDEQEKETTCPTITSSFFRKGNETVVHVVATLVSDRVNPYWPLALCCDDAVTATRWLTEESFADPNMKHRELFRAVYLGILAMSTILPMVCIDTIRFRRRSVFQDVPEMLRLELVSRRGAPQFLTLRLLFAVNLVQIHRGMPGG
jgi:hypothetical protein